MDKEKILVVEDDVDINNLIKMTLEKLGYEIIQAFSGSEAGLMSISWTQKVKLFYAALLASNSHCSGVM